MLSGLAVTVLKAVVHLDGLLDGIDARERSLDVVVFQHRFDVHEAADTLHLHDDVAKLHQVTLLDAGCDASVNAGLDILVTALDQLGVLRLDQQRCLGILLVFLIAPTRRPTP